MQPQLVIPADPVVDQGGRIQQFGLRQRSPADEFGRIRDVVVVRRRCRGELAVGVPAVPALYRADGLALATRFAGVEEGLSRAGKTTRSRRSAGTPTVTRRAGPGMKGFVGR